MAVSKTSSSMSSMLGITGKGIGGLATGLDTDSLVEALTSSTRSKIAKQGQQKQLLNWKMTAYRTMTTALTAFQSKYLGSSSTSTTSVRNSSFFNAYKATSSSSKISVSATSSSSTGNFTIDKVTSVATAEKISSTNKLSSTLSLGNITEGKQVGAGAFTGKTLELEVSGFATKTIKLDDLNSAIRTEDGTIDIEKFQTGLQSLIDKAYGTKTGGHVVDVGLIDVTDEDGNTIRGEDGEPIKGIKLDSDTATIYIHKTNNLLGVTGGDTNRVSTSTKLGALDAFKNVQGNTMTFSINGTEIEVSKDDTISSLMKKVNNSNAGVKMEYDQYSDKFTLTSKATGAGENMVVRDVHGNLMNEIFGAQGGNGIGTGFLTTGDSVKSLNANTIDSMTNDERKALASSLSKMTFNMTVNGETKTITLNTSVIDPNKLANGTYTSTDVLNAINKGVQATTAFYGSDVKFSYEEGTGKTIISSNSGEAFSVKISGTLGQLLGTGSGTFGNTVMDYGLGSTISSTSAATFGNFGITGTGGAFDMTINGVTKTLSIGAFTSVDQNIHMKDALNAAISAAFGSDIASKVKFDGVNEVAQRQKVDGDNNPVFEEDGVTPVMEDYVKSVALTLNISDSSMSVAMGAASNVGADQVNIYSALGFSGTNAPVTNSTGTGIALKDLVGGDIGTGILTVNGKTFSYDESMTLDQFLTGLNSALGGTAVAGIKDGKLYINSTSDEIRIKDEKTVYDSDTDAMKVVTDSDSNPVNGNLLSNLFGVSGGSFATAGETYKTGTGYKEGTNAEIKIGNEVISSASNTITYNGVTITVNEKSEVDDKPINVGVTYDVDDVVTRIKSWMDDYNALVYTINSAISESKNLDYSPLTDEQKEDMTESQIAKWESEAKKGILRNDQTLRSILSDMRATFYQKVEAAGISLYDIGIVTKSGLTDPNEAGQLEFDQNTTVKGEDRLRTMLSNDPDAVRLLFTADDGIGAKLNDVITRAASESSTNRGTLVRIAGTEKITGDNTSQLKTKISAIDTYISQLKSRLESEYNRYWRKFSSLETSVQKLNSQSSWLQSS